MKPHEKIQGQGEVHINNQTKLVLQYSCHFMNQTKKLKVYPKYSTHTLPQSQPNVAQGLTSKDQIILL